MESVVLALTYVLGGMVFASGVYLVLHNTFPSWWRGWMLWPLVRVTPTVTHFQGWAAVTYGGSILLIGFAFLSPAYLAGLLFVAAVLAYLAGTFLFIYSTYVSRKRAAAATLPPV
jgi:hypothetical protein